MKNTRLYMDPGSKWQIRNLEYGYLGKKLIIGNSGISFHRNLFRIIL